MRVRPSFVMFSALAFAGCDGGAPPAASSGKKAATPASSTVESGQEAASPGNEKTPPVPTTSSPKNDPNQILGVELGLVDAADGKLTTTGFSFPVPSSGAKLEVGTGVSVVGLAGMDPKTVKVVTVKEEFGEAEAWWEVTVSPTDLGVYDGEQLIHPVLVLWPAMEGVTEVPMKVLLADLPKVVTDVCGPKPDPAAGFVAVAADVNGDGSPDAMAMTCEDSDENEVSGSFVRRSSGQWEALSTSWAE